MAMHSGRTGPAWSLHVPIRENAIVAVARAHRAAGSYARGGGHPVRERRCRGCHGACLLARGTAIAATLARVMSDTRPALAEMASLNVRPRNLKAGLSCGIDRVAQKG